MGHSVLMLQFNLFKYYEYIVLQKKKEKYAKL